MAGSKPRFGLREATPADAEGMASVALAILASNPVSRGMYGPSGLTDVAKSKMRANMEKELRDPESATSYIVAEASDKMVGVAEWHFHPSSTEYAPPNTADVAGSLEERFFNGCRQLRERYIQGRPHASITLLAVDPAMRGQGVGRALMKWGMERADNAGLDIWLTSTPMGWPLYRACGFKNVDILDFELKGHGVVKTGDDDDWGDKVLTEGAHEPLKDGYYREILMLRRHAS